MRKIAKLIIVEQCRTFFDTSGMLVYLRLNEILIIFGLMLLILIGRFMTGSIRAFSNSLRNTE